MSAIPKIVKYFFEPLIIKSCSVAQIFLSALTGIFLLALLFGIAPPSAQAKFVQLDMALDVKSRFSDGCSSIQELASLAQHRGIDAVIFSDHLRDSLEYGIFPLEKIIKKKRENPSVAVSGINTYLAEIALNDKIFTNVRLLPSIEISPFYYWTGNPFPEGLVARDHDKHLAIIGLEYVKDYAGLPALNGKFSKRYVGQAKLRFLFFGALFFVSVALVVFYRDSYPKSVYLFLTAAILLLANNHPFISSPYNQYDGDQGSAPYQEVIDYVNDRGGMAFWNHLETDYQRQARGDSLMHTETPPHPSDLLLTKNYTGFQAVNDTPIAATEPGREWDQVLSQYLSGERAKPVWGYGANDFHCEGQDGHKLGSVRTIALVSENSDDGVFNALRTGRMYAVRSSGEDGRLSLDEFSVRDRVTGNKATLGQELEAGDFPEIIVALSSTQGSLASARLTLIRDGKIVKEETVSLPHQMVWRDLGVERKGKVYYRLKVESGAGGLLLSNPVFVKFSGAHVQVAAVEKRLEQTIMKRKKFKIAEPPVPPDSMFEEQKLKIFETEPSLAKVLAAPQKKLTKPRQAPQPVAAQRREAVTAGKASLTNEPPALKPRESSASGKYVVATVNNLALRKGPGKIFPSIGKVDKGEKLLFVRKTGIFLDGSPWIVVKKNKQMYYVWEGFLQFE